MEEMDGGAETTLSGCASKRRPLKNTRRRRCWPASQPASQSWIWIYGRHEPLRVFLIVIVETYEGHLVVHRDESCVLDGVAEHAHQEVQAVEGQRREYPRGGIGGVVAHCDEERDKAEYTRGVLAQLL